VAIGIPLGNVFAKLHVGRRFFPIGKFSPESPQVKPNCPERYISAFGRSISIDACTNHRVLIENDAESMTQL
jgi:hypothetical protein